MSDPQNVTSHDGPVFNAGVSHTQLAWNNETVTQNQQSNGGPVAPGYEALAELVTRLLGQLPEQGLAERDREDAEVAAQEVLAEITRTDAAPEEGRLRRALAGLRGALAPVATGVVAGTAVGAQEWALAAIAGLTGVG
ncbi:MULTISPECIES: hypothetical protein [Streptomyces]|uniref:hypothetical protein n=1 Tax=Streptomyces TaxID=1883 RepID=UPI000464FB2D|nr:hypothetical protein [Streptomyces exfoliatus]